MKRFLVCLLACALLCSLVPALAADTTVTVMIYMCASNLETDDGAATADINEMVYADTNPNVRVVLQTGGTNSWQNTYMQDGATERFLIEGGQITRLSTLGQKDMTSEDTFADFLAFCRDHYKADRNILILWDHGAGPIGGFGVDEVFPDGSLSLSRIHSALQKTNMRFDLFAFDACLMGSVESALAVADYADYYLASEESVINSGLSYQSLLDTLAKDPSLPTDRLGASMVDAYLASSDEKQMTMSLIDLKALKNDVLPLLSAFAADAEALVTGGEYASVARVRSLSRAFGYTEYDLVDLIDLMERSKLESGKRAAEALRASIVKNGSSSDMKVSNGLSVYFPYSNLDLLYAMEDAFANIDTLADFKELTYRFAGVRANGQTASAGQTSPHDDQTDDEPVDYSWLSDLLDSLGLSSNEEQTADSESLSELPLTKKDDVCVLSLTEQEWDQIADINLQYYIDDGECYMELGVDGAYFDDDKDLIVDFDNSWFMLDGVLLSYYNEYRGEDGGEQFSFDYAPVLLNGVPRELVVMWSSAYEGETLVGGWEGGRILGSRAPYSKDTSFGALSPLKDGDIIEPLFDCYTYDGAYDDQYTLNEQTTYKEGLHVTREDIGQETVELYAMLTDIYGNTYWTETLRIE